MYKKFTIISILLLSVSSLFANGSKESTANIEIETGDKVLHLAGGNVGVLNPFQHMNRGPGIFRTFLVFDSLLEKMKQG